VRAGASARTEMKRQNRELLCVIGPHPGARTQHACALRCGVGGSIQSLRAARGQINASRIQCQESAARRWRYRKRGRGETARCCLENYKLQLLAPREALGHHQRSTRKYDDLFVIVPSNLRSRTRPWCRHEAPAKDRRRRRRRRRR